MQLKRTLPGWKKNGIKLDKKLLDFLSADSKGTLDVQDSKADDWTGFLSTRLEPWTLQTFSIRRAAEDCRKSVRQNRCWFSKLRGSAARIVPKLTCAWLLKFVWNAENICSTRHLSVDKRCSYCPKGYIHAAVIHSWQSLYIYNMYTIYISI